MAMGINTDETASAPVMSPPEGCSRDGSVAAGRVMTVHALKVLPLAGLLLLAACGPNYGDRGTRHLRGNGYGDIGVGAKGSYGFDGPP